MDYKAWSKEMGDEIGRAAIVDCANRMKRLSVVLEQPLEYSLQYLENGRFVVVSTFNGKVARYEILENTEGRGFGLIQVAIDS